MQLCSLFSTKDIMEAVQRMKSNVIDGRSELFSDHTINGCDSIFVFINLLFNGMLCHGMCPDDVSKAPFIPVP